MGAGNDNFPINRRVHGLVSLGSHVAYFIAGVSLVLADSKDCQGCVCDLHSCPDQADYFRLF